MIQNYKKIVENKYDILLTLIILGAVIVLFTRNGSNNRFKTIYNKINIHDILKKNILFILLVILLIICIIHFINGKKKTINILGNGSSLKNFDFNILDGETIGTCLAYRYWYKINWFPDHYCCVDDVVIKSNIEDIKKLIVENRCKTYLLTKSIINHWKDVKNYKNVYYIQDFRGDKNNIFSELNQYCSGSSATLYAYLLGAEKINLFGIDCNYKEFLPETRKLNDGTLMITKTPIHNPNYFIDDYQREGDIYNKPKTRTVHYVSWGMINNIIGKKTEIINYNKTDKLDQFFTRENQYKGFYF